MGYVGSTPANTALTGADITDGIIANADIASDAAIAMSKTALAAGTGITLATNTLNVDAAQTGITSIYATALILGEDSETAIDFGTANEIDFKINNTTELTLDATALYPTGDAGLDLGTASLEFKDAFFDGTVTSDAFAGPLTGNVTGTADVATVATTVTITDNESTDEDNAIIFTAGGDVDGGNIGLESDGTLTYNPSTGRLTATQLAGTLQTAAQTNVTSVSTLDGGAISSGFGNIDVGSSNLTATGTISLGATSFNDNDITNVGDIALDSVSADGTDINVAVSDNSATALTIKQGSDAYLIIDTANSSESVSIGTGISGTAITIGHGTSETTFGDNVTITGDLTINGATVTNATTNLTVADPLVKYGQAYVGSAYDQGFIVTRGDASSTNTQNMGFIWDESADEFATIKAATEDGTTAGNVTVTDYVNLHVGAITADDASTFTSTISAATGSTIGNLTLANGSITDSSGAIDFGNETLTTSGAVATGALTVTGDTIVGNGYGLLVGHASQVTAAGSSTAEVQVLGTSGSDSMIKVGRFGADEYGPAFTFLKSRDPAIADGSFAIVADDDLVGRFRYAVDDGNDFNTEIARIEVEVDDGSPAENAVGGAIVLRTATTSGSMTEAFRIDSSQNATFAGSIELGAVDTTIARASAGDVNIEGNIIYRAGGTDVAVADGGTGQSNLNDLITMGTHTTGNFVADITAGSLIDVSGGGSEDATVTVNVDLTELTDGTSAIVGSEDELVYLDNGTQKRKLISEITLSDFSNDSGWTTNTGDITGVTAGTGLSGGGSSGSVTLNLDTITSVGTITSGTWQGTTVAVNQGGTGVTSLGSLNISSFNNDSGFTANSGDITGVTAGTGLSGGGSSGSVTLNVDASQTQITGVGTITTGTWQGTTVAVNQGGTGVTSLGSINISSFNNNSGFTSNTGDITNVSAGTDITGGGSSGSVTITLDTTLTSVTSMYNASLNIGRDTHNRFVFSTDNAIKVSVNAVDDEFRFAAGGNFHADADVYAYSTTTASDLALKKNILPIDSAIDKVKQLTGVTFDWKREKLGRSAGLIAQDVEKILPQLVKEVPALKTDTTQKHLNYNGVVGLLVEAVKELAEKVGD